MNARFNGRLVSEVAEELGLSPWDALCEVLLADDLQTGLMQVERGQDDESWERRVELWPTRGRWWACPTPVPTST